MEYNISLKRCPDYLGKVEPNTMVAKSADGMHGSVSMLRDIPTLVSPGKMDRRSREDSPNQEPDSPDLQQIQVSYSEASLERTSSGDGSADDGIIFRDSVQMGKHLETSGNFSQALQYYGSALKCKYRKIDSEPLHIRREFGDVLFAIGKIHLVPGFVDREKSINAFYFCLDVRRACLGSSHPDVASVLYHLALIHSYNAEYEWSLDMLLESLSILLCDPTWGGEPTLLQLWTAIGEVQESLGQFDEAKSSFHEAELLK